MYEVCCRTQVQIGLNQQTSKVNRETDELDKNPGDTDGSCKMFRMIATKLDTAPTRGTSIHGPWWSYWEFTFSEDRTVYTMPNTSKMDRTHWATEMPRQNMQRNVNMVKNKLSFVHKDTCLCFFQHKISKN